MKDIIVAVDFSETSLNAVRYAADMLSGKPEIHVILYNMFGEDSDGETSGHYLETLRSEMLQKGVTDNIECVKEFGDDLVDLLGRLAHQKNAEMIVMGINEKEDRKSFFGRSHSVSMARANICPVLIVPPFAKYNGIRNVALTSDFKDVENATPVLAIKTILGLFNAGLHIVNVDNQHYVSLTDQFLAERSKMLKMFEEFNPEFYFIGMNDFYDAIQQFTRDRGIDLIVIIPKNHSFTERIFAESHTEKLAYQTEVPLLAAHE
jgi:nucleotide-binding universal stress UspA family protein